MSADEIMRNYRLRVAGEKAIRADERRKVWAEAAEMVREQCAVSCPSRTANHVCAHTELADAMAAKGAE